jgi:hypothetical protein
MSKYLVALYYSDENDNNNVQGLANIFWKMCSFLYCAFFLLQSKNPFAKTFVLGMK